METFKPTVCCNQAIDLITIYQNKFIFQCKRCGKIFITKNLEERNKK